VAEPFRLQNVSINHCADAPFNWRRPAAARSAHSNRLSVLAYVRFQGGPLSSWLSIRPRLYSEKHSVCFIANFKF